MDKLSFEDLNISSEIAKAIEDLGFEEATPIQYKSIPIIMEGKDVIGQAQTGTGKTAAFGIPMIEKIDKTSHDLQALVLCPTRELAIQVSEELRKFSTYKKGIYIVPIYGGQNIERQFSALRKGVQIVIGTPGRVLDHLERKTLNLSNLKMMILDEADKMLDMGFREDIEAVLKSAPKERQTVLFSATMPDPILRITKQFQKTPVHIKIEHKQMTVPLIEQIYMEMRESQKIEALSRIIDIYNPKLALVFCNTKKKVDETVDHLQARGYFTDGLHGDMKQMQRDRIMKAFRNEKIQVLVATDVAARGLDIDDVEVVFNYDVPKDDEDYVHRIGRTGRAGKAGKAFTFAVGKELYKLREIQRYTKAKMVRQPIPTLSEVEDVKNSVALQKVKDVIEEGNLEKYTSLVEKFLSEDFTSIDVASALLKMMMQKNSKSGEEDDQDNGQGFKSDSGSIKTRLFINAGRSQRISPRDIVGAITGEAGIPGSDIGAIDIFDDYSFVDVPKSAAKDIIEAMRSCQIRGKRIRLEIANKK